MLVPERGNDGGLHSGDLCRSMQDPSRILLEECPSRVALGKARLRIRIDHKRKEHAVQLMTMRGASDSISATPLIYGARARTFQRGRVCGTPGCSTVLSRYNPTKRCSLHGTRH